ncbi:MAG: aldehyde dehydrogenase family protein [Candidatus Latescibacteria bacterium]|nr:aldehyde dehydrogenase family protein [Candidatus Latescibacterota bacterium]
MLHIPILRAGEPYESLQTAPIKHIASGEILGQVSQANRGLIARDLGRIGQHKQTLEEHSHADLLALCREAARLFIEGELPLGDSTQTPADYVEQLSATTGLPHTLCRANMGKIHSLLEQMEAVLDGLTRGLDLDLLDSGWSHQQGRPLSYVCQTQALGAILPSNSPGVHALWLPAIPLKVPLVLKPGGQEPWTPYRIAQAFMAAGCPPQAFSYYPTDYGGAAEILLRCDRSMFFGAAATVDAWKGDPGVQIHGPGRSKVVLGADQAGEWEQYLDAMVESVAANSGRSCINASSVWMPAHGRALAEALAQRLGQIEALPLEHPQAQLSAFSNPEMAQRLDQMIESQLKIPGAEVLTPGPRLVEVDGCTFLRPTVVWCTDPEHPLANSEFLFPFTSVVEVPQDELLGCMGPTLVVSAVTEDTGFIAQLLASPHVERLNLGPVPTGRLTYDQPHEGNIFELLYRQRALQV